MLEELRVSHFAQTLARGRRLAKRIRRALRGRRRSPGEPQPPDERPGWTRPHTRCDARPLLAHTASNRRPTACRLDAVAYCERCEHGLSARLPAADGVPAPGPLRLLARAPASVFPPPAMNRARAVDSTAVHSPGSMPAAARGRSALITPAGSGLARPRSPGPARAVEPGSVHGTVCPSHAGRHPRPPAPLGQPRTVAAAITAVASPGRGPPPRLDAVRDPRARSGRARGSRSRSASRTCRRCSARACGSRSRALRCSRSRGRSGGRCGPTWRSRRCSGCCRSPPRTGSSTGVSSTFRRAWPRCCSA